MTSISENTLIKSSLVLQQKVLLHKNIWVFVCDLSPDILPRAETEEELTLTAIVLSNLDEVSVQILTHMFISST